ncbi:MAG: zinc carboxypeptidase, partial [Thermoplasmatales archaeon]|nr:zinc carboxypeptidase [Thermoplasmatales archaeon]
MIERKITCILVLSMLITISLSVSGNDKVTLERPSNLANLNMVKENFNSLSTNVLVRINTTEEDALMPGEFEIIGINPGKWIDTIIPQSRLFELSNEGLDYSVLIWDVDAYSESVKGMYHTFTEMEGVLQNIANNYPDITSLYSIGTSYEGRDIWCLEISDNPGVDEGEPGVFYMGLHHAREWPTLEICLNIAENLTSNYGSDPDITDVIDNRRLWLVPCVNPDGYHYDHDLGNDWRKNRHYFPEFDTYGVDLNRNYGGSSNGNIWGAWGSIGTASVTHDPSSSLYCGPGPISELETQAIRDIFLENNICASITWHTHGEIVIWPWSYSGDEVTPDNIYMVQVGQGIAQRITKMSGSGTYVPKQASELYPTTGDTTEWAYGYGHYVQGRPTFVYTIEACNTFHPSASYLDQVCEENFDAALYLLQEAENINDVIPRVIPPEINEIPDESDGYYTVSWSEKNPNANPDYFQLDELTGLSLVNDDAESGSDLWT